MCLSVIFPFFFLPVSIIGFVYRTLAIGYLNTGRDLRRMESNSHSSIFSGFGELLEGIVTVRAFSAEKRFLDDLHLKVDLTNRVSVLWKSKGDLPAHKNTDEV
jgi:ABC-type multidrug transport system fused ATPase/permease subunit